MEDHGAAGLDGHGDLVAGVPLLLRPPKRDQDGVRLGRGGAAPGARPAAARRAGAPPPRRAAGARRPRAAGARPGRAAGRAAPGRPPGGRSGPTAGTRRSWGRSRGPFSAICPQARRRAAHAPSGPRRAGTGYRSRYWTCTGFIDLDHTGDRRLLGSRWDCRSRRRSAGGCALAAALGAPPRGPRHAVRVLDAQRQVGERDLQGQLQARVACRAGGPARPAAATSSRWRSSGHDSSSSSRATRRAGRASPAARSVSKWAGRLSSVATIGSRSVSSAPTKRIPKSSSW